MGIDDNDELKEYVVSLHRHEDLEGFYDDMETPGGNLYIPNRAVPVYSRRQLSRSTHYLLTDTEAEQLRSDPRVGNVSRTLRDLGITMVPRWTQFSNNWLKALNNTTPLQKEDKNWALLRCTTKNNNDPNWGAEVSATTGRGPRISGTAQTDADGRNVDVVIVDGLIRQTHAEFRNDQNQNRVIRNDWFQYFTRATNPRYSLRWFTYNYDVAAQAPQNNASPAARQQLIDNDDHGTHVAGIAVGNTQGWARKANLYNISPYDVGGDAEPFTNQISAVEVLDAIKGWINRKSVNPAIGQKNPTVINMSYGPQPYEILVSDIRNINYRGTSYSGPWNASGNGQFTYRQLGILGSYQYSDGSTYILVPHVAGGSADPFFNVNQDVEDLVTLYQCHVVIAADNYAFKFDVPGGPDYNNFVYTNRASTFYYNRPGAPHSQYAFHIGSVNSYATATISDFSARGPRIDVFAPGSGIVSSIYNNSQTEPDGTSNRSVNDPRNTTDRIEIFQGCSMATPQVTGVIACLLEKYPSMTPAAMKTLIINESYKNQLLDQPGSLGDFKNSFNRILRYPLAGNVTTLGPSPTTTPPTTRPPTTPPPTPPPTITLGDFFVLTVTPGTTISEGDTAEICLEVNPNRVTNGTQIPFTITVAPI